MITSISVQNFKSVEKLTLPLGRVTVLIGENGSGKSNILEAIALLGAAAVDKLDNEFLFTRGIRVTEETLMCSAFPTKSGDVELDGADVIRLVAQGSEGAEFSCRLLPSYSEPNDAFIGWQCLPLVQNKAVEQVFEGVSEEVRLKTARMIEQLLAKYPDRTFEGEGPGGTKSVHDFMRQYGEDIALRLTLMDKTQRRNAESAERLGLGRFLIYAPENTALRRFEEEGQIQPVGIRGEGLFRFLQTFGAKGNEGRLADLMRSLELVGWFFDFSIPSNLAPGEYRLCIHDRFLGPDVSLDQRSANEGFLFLLFYFSVFLGKATPSFFAIDNIDASLNPKLCAELMRRLCELAKKYDKQVIVTTHNPAILDGLNLHDEEQRLLAVYRNEEGRTRVRRIMAPKAPPSGRSPIKLSEAFLQGLIGGLPKNF